MKDNPFCPAHPHDRMKRVDSVFCCQVNDCNFQFDVQNGYVPKDVQLDIKCSQDRRMYIKHVFPPIATFLWACTWDGCEETKSLLIPQAYKRVGADLGKPAKGPRRLTQGLEV
jgi:hypothetical protein